MRACQSPPSLLVARGPRHWPRKDLEQVSLGQTFSAVCGAAIRPGWGWWTAWGPFTQPHPAQRAVWLWGPGRARPGTAVAPLPLFQDSEQLHGTAEDQPGAGGQAIPHGEGHHPMPHGPPPGPSPRAPSSETVVGSCRPSYYPLALIESRASFPDALGLGHQSHPFYAEGGCSQDK